MIDDIDPTYIDPTYVIAPSYLVCAPGTDQGHENVTALSASPEGNAVDGTYITVTLSTGSNQGHKTAEGVEGFIGSTHVKQDTRPYTIWDEPEPCLEPCDTPPLETVDRSKQWRTLARGIRRISKRLSRRDGTNLDTPTNINGPSMRPSMNDNDMMLQRPALGSTLQWDRGGRQRLTPAYAAVPAFEDPALPTADGRTLQRDSVDRVGA